MSGFVYVDLDGATAADGVVRSARKILQDGAKSLARSRTYAWALLERQVSGASAGLSVDPSDHGAAIRVFVDAVAERVAAGELALDPAKGVTARELAELNAVDRRSTLRDIERPTGTLADELLAASVTSAAATALGDSGLDGRTVAVEGAGSSLPAVLAALDAAGATVVAVGSASGTVADRAGLDAAAVAEALAEHGEGFPTALGSELPAPAVLSADAQVLLCGSRVGLIDHDVAAELPHQLVAPVGPVPVTAKALAVAGRRDIAVLADFLTCAGPLLAFRPAEDATPDGLLDEAARRATELTAELTDHPDGPFLGACRRAEQYLGTWQERLPFGRPLA